ncbi:MAG: phosphatidylglycerophosphatase A [Phycisphaerae bacterium]
MNRKTKIWLASGLYTGYLRPAPGTWGSGVIVLAFLGALWLSGGMGWLVSTMMGLISGASALGCVMLGRFVENEFGRKDPSFCTIDEFAGQGLTYVALPLSGSWLGSQAGDWLLVATLGFVIFRVMDIFKPFPARRLEKLPHGWGVAFDDLFAGLYANLTCQLILRLGLQMS